MIIPAYSSKIECGGFQFKKFVNQVNGSRSSCDRISFFADDLLQIFAIFKKFQSKCWTHLNAIYFCFVSSMSRPQVLLVPSFDRLRWVQRCSGKFLSTESTVRLLMDHWELFGTVNVWSKVEEWSWFHPVSVRLLAAGSNKVMLKWLHICPKTLL